jgi:thiamine biosynthesis lipoprotein
MPTHVEHVMGMAVSIDIRGLDAWPVGAVTDVVDWLHYIDATFSTYRPDSPISRLGRGDITLAQTPSLVRHVLARCDEIRDETLGYFNAWTDGVLDPSGYVKGWAVDAASQILFDAGVGDHAINAGGDVRLRGRPAAGELWQVGIAHPLVRDAVCSIIEIGDGAVATSGTAERGAHVINPHTGGAALDLASVTVIGPTLTRADAYATAALAMGFAAPEWLATLDGYRAYIVDAGGFEWSTRAPSLSEN